MRFIVALSRRRSSWRFTAGSSLPPRSLVASRFHGTSTQNDDDETPLSFVQNELLTSSLKGIGQVIFLNSRQSGLILLGGLAYGDPVLASMAAWGSAVSTGSAYAIGLDKSSRINGLYGYNGCLVGCASSVFLSGGMATAVAATTTGAALCPLVGTAIGQGMGSTPQWTLAFNAVTLSMLLRTKPLQISDSAAEAVTTPLTTWSSIAEGPIKGVSQIFVVESTVSGAIILYGIYAYSPLLAAHALTGSTIGTLAGGICMGAPGHELAMGLWGFNSALTSMAVGVFFVPNKESATLSVTGAAVTAGVFGALKTVFGDALGAPALTLPFCITATACYWLAGPVPGLEIAKSPHSPEKN